MSRSPTGSRPNAADVPVDVLGLPTRFIPHGEAAPHPRPARPRRRRHRAHALPRAPPAVTGPLDDRRATTSSGRARAGARAGRPRRRASRCRASSDQDFTLGWKDNRTEVTEADRGAETLLAERLLGGPARRRPVRRGARPVGRRPTRRGGGSIDPIDGTSGFVRGIPVWATLIALTHAERGAVVGVVSAPALGRRWWAARGLGRVRRRPTLPGERRRRRSPTPRCASRSAPAGTSSGCTSALVALLQRARRRARVRRLLAALLVAEGAVDLAIDAVGVMPYDLAAVKVIVEEAGGTFTDRHGVRTLRARHGDQLQRPAPRLSALDAGAWRVGHATT